MKIFIVSILVLAVLIIIIFSSRLTITAQYVHKDRKDHFTVRIVALFGLVSKTFSLPVALEEKREEDALKKERQKVEQRERKPIFKKIRADAQIAKDFLRLLNDSKHTLRKFLKKTVVHEFSWVSTIGAGDAALTGKLFGAAWSIKGIVQMLVYRFLTVRCRPCYDVTALYYNRAISTEFICIFSFRVGDAILTAIQLLRYWKSGKSNAPSSLIFKTNKTAYQEE